MPPSGRQSQNPPEVDVERPAMSSAQTRMIDDPHPILWIGTGTKTGKTVAGAWWLVEGVALGQRCAVVGPWSIENLDPVPVDSVDLLTATYRKHKCHG